MARDAGPEGVDWARLRLEDTERVEAELKRQEVRVAVRDGYLRASFHFFNDESDVERALTALRSR